MAITIHSITADDFGALAQLQSDVWGVDNQMPASLFRIAQSIGGVALGAYNNDQLVGFILSLPAVWQGKQAQWSCRLAVQKEHRNQGIGGQLKAAQKEALCDMNIASLLWSFNPYDTKNAHLNLNKLGARIVGFESDMYPVSPGERAIVDWQLNTPTKLTPSATQTIAIPTTPNETFCSTIKTALADGFIGTLIEFDADQPYYQFNAYD